MIEKKLKQNVDPSIFPLNYGLLKIIEFRKNEKIAFEKMKSYQIENPNFFSKIEETVIRSHKPFQIQIYEIT